MPQQPPAALRFRVMATSDLHMALLGYDYTADRPRDGGLARLATLIARLRAEVGDNLLLDNGDLLQGNALGDWLAETRAASHPMIAVMNTLGYDAATLGNHDVDYGLGYLRRALAQARFSVVASNLRLSEPMPGLVSHLLLSRRVTRTDGIAADLRIGLVGLLPPQTLAWGMVQLAGRAEIDDICAAGVAAARALRAEGADLVVALCHSGLGPATSTPGMENAAAALAGAAAVDAVIAGHSHLVSPDPLAGCPDDEQTSGTAEVGPDCRSGGVPVVQPGSLGSHLGVIDLDLMQDRTGRWRVIQSRARAIAVPATLPEDPQIAALAAPAHVATRRHLKRRVGWSHRPLTTCFALVAPSPALGLIAESHRAYITAALRGTAQAGLPVLAAVAPLKAGGRGGPTHYTEVAEGPLTLRALADLYIYTNHLAAVEVTGAELADWLERSASVYAQIVPGVADQPLLNPEVPAFEVDAVHGVSYVFDLTAPARFCPAGRLRDPDAHRLRDLCHQGRPVAPDDRFVVATNDYRIATRGMAGRAGSQIFRTRARDVLRGYLEAAGPVCPTAADWRLLPAGGANAIFDTSPTAADHMPDPSRVRLTALGPGPGGFARYRVDL